MKAFVDRSSEMETLENEYKRKGSFKLPGLHMLKHVNRTVIFFFAPVSFATIFENLFQLK